MLEILATIGFDWHVALANTVSFLIIFFILKKYVFGPMGKTLADRKALIQSGLDNAADAKKAREDAEKDASAQMKAAKAEANQIIATAQGEAKGIVDAAASKAEDAAASVMQDAELKIAQERKDMEKDLFEKTAALVSMGVQKILEEDLNADQNKKLNERALEVITKD